MRGYVRRLSLKQDGVLRPLRAYFRMLTCQPGWRQRFHIDGLVSVQSSANSTGSERQQNLIIQQQRNALNETPNLVQSCPDISLSKPSLVEVSMQLAGVVEAY